MTGSIGGRWTAGNRLEPSRPNGRGWIPPSGLTPSPSRSRDAGPGQPAPGRAVLGRGSLPAWCRGEPAQDSTRPRSRSRCQPCRARGRTDRPRGHGVGAARGVGAAGSVVCWWPSGAAVSRSGGWGVPVAESALVPPGPIPNPVVTQRSAGEYWGGDPLGGEAAADTPHPRSRGRAGAGVPPILTSSRPHVLTSTRRGVEQRQLVGLIPHRSGVRIPPPLPGARTEIAPCGLLRARSNSLNR